VSEVKDGCWRSKASIRSKCWALELSNTTIFTATPQICKMFLQMSGECWKWWALESSGGCQRQMMGAGYHWWALEPSRGCRSHQTQKFSLPLYKYGLFCACWWVLVHWRQVLGVKLAGGCQKQIMGIGTQWWVSEPNGSKRWVLELSNITIFPATPSIWLDLCLLLELVVGARVLEASSGCWR